jgi:chemotaxis protein MotB
MRRRGRSAHPENHERWLVSYADFITLLFAFFVMMYANSKTDQLKAQQIAASFRQAMSEGRLSQALSRLVNPGAESSQKAKSPRVQQEPIQEEKPGQVVELLPSLVQLRESLKKEIAAGRLDVRMERRGLVISLREATFFPPGNDTVEVSTYTTLEIIAQELKRSPNPIRMEGHTDAVPIHTERFRSNWHLSAARGIAMMELFTNRFGFPAERIAIAGFAETAPVAANDSSEGRARNRRVDIVVLNEEGMISEPVRSGAVKSGDGGHRPEASH